MVCLERNERSWGRWDLIWILHHDKNLKADRYRTFPAQINKIIAENYIACLVYSHITQLRCWRVIEIVESN